MRAETGKPPSGEPVVAASSGLSCSAGEVALALEQARLGFICLLRGQGVWHASSGDHPLGPGSVLAWRGEAPAALVFTTSAEVAVVSIDRATAEGHLFQELYPAPTLAHFGSAAALERLRGLLALLPPARAVSNPRTDECLLLALIWSVREQSTRSGADALSDPAVSNALGILEREFARPMSVPLLAKRVGLSRSAFVRRFSAALGLPPEKYLTWLRLRRAAELLVTTDAGLSAIASEVGYGSEFSFSRAFRRWYGVPPGTYRKQPSGSVPRILALAA